MDDRTGKEIMEAWRAVLNEEKELLTEHLNSSYPLEDYQSRLEPINLRRKAEENAYAKWRAEIVEVCEGFTVSEVKIKLSPD